MSLLKKIRPEQPLKNLRWFDIGIVINLIARMDCLLSFAKTSDENRYVRPIVDDSEGHTWKSV